MNNDKFLGHNGFLWFTGVVEDRGDPQKAGRVRVRALGHHTSNTTILPTRLPTILLYYYYYLPTYLPT